MLLVATASLCCCCVHCCCLAPHNVAAGRCLIKLRTQAGPISRRAPRHFSCKAIVAPATHTNGAALGAGKPVLDSPLWRDSFSSDSQHNTASQLYRQPKSILPTRLRLFAGTANPVRSRTLSQAAHRSVCRSDDLRLDTV